MPTVDAPATQRSERDRFSVGLRLPEQSALGRRDDGSTDWGSRDYKCGASEPETTRVWATDRACKRLLWMAITAYVTVFLPLTFSFYDRFTTMSYDLGIFDQATWLISRGHSPFVTIRGLPLLADHFSAILYLLAPLYWVWPSAKALLAAQTIALSLGALPLYALARERLRVAPLALCLAIAYLLYPALQWTNAAEFHPDTFATPLLLAALLLLQRQQWRPYFLVLALTLLTKESAGVAVLLIGFYALRTNRRIGWATMMVGVVGLSASLATIRAFNHGAPSAFFALYGPDGGGATGMLGAALCHPLHFFAPLASPVCGFYLLTLLYPLAFLPLLAPEVLLILPLLLVNLLSARPVMHTIEHQYTALLTPFLFLSAIIGMSRLLRWGDRITPLLLAGGLCIGLACAQGQGPLLSWRQWLLPGLSPIAVAQAQQELRVLPPHASVSASPALLSHLDHRVRVYAFPNPFVSVASGPGAQALRQMEYQDDPATSGARIEKAITKALPAAQPEYVFLAPATSTFPLAPRQYPVFVTALLHSPAYGIVSLGDQTLLLRRGADHTAGLRWLAARSGMAVGAFAQGNIVHQRAMLGQAIKKWLNGAACGCSRQAPPA